MSALGLDRETPMWAVPCAMVKLMGAFEVHEDLLADGVLENVRQSAGKSRCLFVSQTWMSFDHPDPLGVKFRLLCELLEGIEAGALDFEAHWEEQVFSGSSRLSREEAGDALADGHVWVDYWSVPQRDFDEQQVYIDSIWLYVQMCSLFVALVPPSMHQDTSEMIDVEVWEGRGWCRLEMVSNILSETPSPHLIVESIGCRYVGSSKQWLTQPVGQGRFSCCQLGHKLPSGQDVACDKERVAGMMERLFDWKIEGTKASGDTFTHRLILCLRQRLLQGLPTSSEESEAGLEEWLQRFEFAPLIAGESICAPLEPTHGSSGEVGGSDGARRIRKADVSSALRRLRVNSGADEAGSGWTPLRYAVYAGRLDIARRLLEEGADVEAPLGRDFSRQVYFHQEGLTILHGAAMLYDAPEVVRFLIHARADAGRQFGAGFNAALASAMGGAAGNLAALSDAGCTLSGAVANYRTAAAKALGGKLEHVEQGKLDKIAKWRHEMETWLTDQEAKHAGSAAQASRACAATRGDSAGSDLLTIMCPRLASAALDAGPDVPTAACVAPGC